jgi:hypothetical protein
VVVVVEQILVVQAAQAAQVVAVMGNLQVLCRPVVPVLLVLVAVVVEMDLELVLLVLVGPV